MTWGRTASAQAGVISRRQLLAAGCTRHRIATLRASGALLTGTPGVYTVRGSAESVERRIWVAVLATAGTVGFATAAALWSVEEEPIGAVDVVVHPTRRVTAPPGVVVHRIFTPAGERTRLRGIPVTSRRWTVLDHLGTLERPAAVRLADRALQRRWITRRDLDARLAEYPCRSGNARLHEVAAIVRDGAAAESERVLHRLLREHRVTGWVANHPVRVGSRLLGVVDVAFPAIRVAVEIDGLAFHQDVDRFRHDRRRQNALVTAGWTVLRFTWADLTERPDYVMATIRGRVRS